jgi:hypothetical protein
MIMRSILILTMVAAVLVGPYSIQSSVAQGPPKPKPYTPTPSYIFGTSSCSAQGSPPAPSAVQPARRLYATTEDKFRANVYAGNNYKVRCFEAAAVGGLVFRLNVRTLSAYDPCPTLASDGRVKVLISLLMY